MKVYHATNLSDQEVNNIKSEGLKMASIDLLKKKAIDRFILPTDHQDVQEKILQKINEEILEEHVTLNEINFSQTQNSLETESYHYLLFGPETLLPLAGVLKKELFINFRSRMINHGSRYMVIATVLTEKVEDLWIEAVFEYLINDFIECSLVYYEDLPINNILEVSKRERPLDTKCFEWM